MGTLREYHTGIGLSRDEYECCPKGPFKGKGWTVRPGRERQKHSGLSGGRLLVVNASSLPGAIRACNMIFSGLCLYQGEPPLCERPIPWPVNGEEQRKMDPVELRLAKSRAFWTDGIMPACMLAARASYRKRHVYALAKYSLSAELYATFSVDLDPHHGSYLPLSSVPDDHVRFAYAIILAYSVIEELGLEVKASAERPSTMEGKWNPIVRKDLETRLRRVGVNLRETFPWNVRGPATKVERTRRVPPAPKAQWARADVRDRELDVCDAILRASWLRSRIAAHSLSDLAASLSPYDVDNVRHLSRRLLLEKLGFWRKRW